MHLLSLALSAMVKTGCALGVIRNVSCQRRLVDKPTSAVQTNCWHSSPTKREALATFLPCKTCIEHTLTNSDSTLAE